MQTILTVVLVVVCIMLVIAVLLQQGKGADAGAAFGSGASGTVFGAGGSATFMSKATAVLATAFFALTLALAYLAGKNGPVATGSSVIEDAPAIDSEAPTINVPDEEEPEIEINIDGEPDTTSNVQVQPSAGVNVTADPVNDVAVDNAINDLIRNSIETPEVVAPTAEEAAQQ